VNLAAIERNVAQLRTGLSRDTAFCAVVKADGYGHGAVPVARATLAGGARLLAVASAGEAVTLRDGGIEAPVLVLGALAGAEVDAAIEARAEVVAWSHEFVDRLARAGGARPLRVHVKLDTGMGRWGLSELTEAPPFEVVGLMSHLATADSDAAYAARQIERFRSATAPYTHLTRHIANSAAALRYPDARFDAARCGIALYGLSPFGTDPVEDGLTPVLSWTSQLALTRLLRAGESTGYGRRYVAEREMWIGIVPVGYADGFRRDLTGTEVRVAGELRRVVGTISMDAFAVELDRELPVGTPVTLIGRGVLAEAHARVADTITYELVSRISADPVRARRVVVDG
jgi:alanine racemase